METEKLLIDESVDAPLAPLETSSETASGHLNLQLQGKMQGILAEVRKAYDLMPYLLYTETLAPVTQVVDTHGIACDSSLLNCCSAAGGVLPCLCACFAPPCFFCCFYSRNRERAGLGSCCGACLWLVLGPPIMAFLAGWFWAKVMECVDSILDAPPQRCG